jgi:hypothetical protein
MTYPPGPPGNSGYQPGSYGASPSSYAPATEPGPSKLPQYLNIAIVLLGAAAYVAAFGPVFATSATYGPFSVEATSTGGILLTLAAVLAALLAAIGLLPRTKQYPTVVAVLAVLGVLAVVEQFVNKPQVMTPTGPQPVSVGWALWAVLAFVVLQAIAAVLVVLYDTGVLSPPAPKPRLEARYGQYAQYGAPGGYYNQPPGPQGGPQPGPRPAYPPQYAGGYQPGPSTGGYGPLGPQGSADQGPPTPPTGYPSFSPPPAVGSGQHHATNPNLGPSQPSPQSSDPSSGSSSS